jgi:hypothetical protein
MSTDIDFESDFSPLGELGNQDFSYAEDLETKKLREHLLREFKASGANPIHIDWSALLKEDLTPCS